MRRALSFLTPFGGAAEPAPSALAWFPAVGALIGLGVGAVWWVARRGRRVAGVGDAAPLWFLGRRRQAQAPADAADPVRPGVEGR